MLGTKIRIQLLVGIASVVFCSALSAQSINLINSDSAFTGTNPNTIPGWYNDFSFAPGSVDNPNSVRDGIYTYSYDASADFDTLVISVSREASSVGQNPNDETFSASYAGQAMTLATGAEAGTGVTIYYLNLTSPTQSGDIALDFSGFQTLNGVGLGIAAIESDNGAPIILTDADTTSGTSVTIEPTLDNSFSMFALDTNGGAFDDLTTPLTQIVKRTDVGSNGYAAAYDLDVAAGSISYSYTGAVNPRGIAAANFAVDGGSVPTGLPGDFNDDLVVDLSDYTLWRNNLGDLDETAISDNGDGMNGVDLADYTLWKSNFGATPQLGAIASASVPEPSSLLTLLAGALALVGLQRRGG